MCQPLPHALRGCEILSFWNILVWTVENESKQYMQCGCESIEVFSIFYRCVFDEIENEYFWKRQGLGAEEEHEIPYIDLQLQTHFVNQKV